MKFFKSALKYEFGVFRLMFVLGGFARFVLLLGILDILVSWGLLLYGILFSPTIHITNLCLFMDFGLGVIWILFSMYFLPKLHKHPKFFSGVQKLFSEFRSQLYSV